MTFVGCDYCFKQALEVPWGDYFAEEWVAPKMAADAAAKEAAVEVAKEAAQKAAVDALVADPSIARVVVETRPVSWAVMAAGGAVSVATVKVVAEVAEDAAAVEVRKKVLIPCRYHCWGGVYGKLAPAMGKHGKGCKNQATCNYVHFGDKEWKEAVALDVAYKSVRN